MKTAKEWIKDLGLRPHQEGGYFTETFRSHERLGENRPLYSSIYFLLEEDNPSNFHRLTADELWYFHSGSPLTIHMINERGNYEKVLLGKDLDQGMVLSYCVKGGVIFGASVDKGYSLVSCMVSPAFDYKDFTLFKRQDLVQAYPIHKDIIEKLTRD